MLASSILLLLTAGSAALAQSNGCQPGFEFGNDTVLFTIPYTYAQVMSIIGSYKNLTWSGNPDSTVTLNGILLSRSHLLLYQSRTSQLDNIVKTTRTYMKSGALVIERILSYSKPAARPCVEIYTLAFLPIAAVIFPSIPTTNTPA